MEDANLILIAQTLSTQLGRIADSLERIERKLNTEPYHDRTEPYHETQHGPTETDPCTTHGHMFTETVSYGDFKGRMTQ